MSELGKTISKKIRPKKQCQNAASEKKPLARNVNLIVKKTRPRMNYEWIGKPFRK